MVGKRERGPLTLPLLKSSELESNGVKEKVPILESSDFKESSKKVPIAKSSDFEVMEKEVPKVPISKVLILETKDLKKAKVPIAKIPDSKKLEKGSGPKVPKSKSSGSLVRKKKVRVSEKVPSGKRADVLKNEEKVRLAYLKLENELGKVPTRIQVSQATGLSSKKVGQYYKTLNL
jgi:hypothetical protein